MARLVSKSPLANHIRAEEEVGLLRDFLTGTSIKGMKYFYEDALLVLSTGRSIKSNARERYEKRLMELGVLSEWRAEENQKLIEKIAKREPVETGEREIVFTKEIIESVLSNLENVAARIERFFTRESSTTRKPSIVGKVLWNSEPAENISVKLCTLFPLFLGGCEALEKDTITNASGEYQYFNISSGKYGLLYKWPEWDSDDWGLGQTEEDRVIRIIVEEKGVAKADPLIAFKKIKLISPEEILDYPRVLPVTNQKTIFKWKPIEGAITYLVVIFEVNEDLSLGDTVLERIIADPSVETLLVFFPKKELQLQIRAYNYDFEKRLPGENIFKGLITEGFYGFEVK